MGVHFVTKVSSRALTGSRRVRAPVGLRLLTPNLCLYVSPTSISIHPSELRQTGAMNLGRESPVDRGKSGCDHVHVVRRTFLTLALPSLSVPDRRECIGKTTREEKGSSATSSNVTRGRPQHRRRWLKQQRRCVRGPMEVPGVQASTSGINGGQRGDRGEAGPRQVRRVRGGLNGTAFSASSAMGRDAFGKR